MAQKATKHPGMTHAMFNDFSGGLNYLVPPEQIEASEMQECVNFEFNKSSGKLESRDGLMKIADSPDGEIVGMFPYPSNVLMVLVKDSTSPGNSLLYKRDGETLSLVGSVSGDGTLTWDTWGLYGDVIFSLGKSIHLYDGTSVTKLTASPNTKMVFSHLSRVLSVDTDNKRISYSSVGDAADWTNVESVESSAMWVDVSSHDGLEIVGAAPLMKDLIIFKAPGGSGFYMPQYGMIYRLVGIYPDWDVENAQTGMSCFSPNAILPLGDLVYFLHRFGLSALMPDPTYGEIKMANPGNKINPVLNTVLNDESRMIHIASKGQIWVLPGNSKKVWIFHYLIGEGAWTQFSFQYEVQDVLEIGGNVFIAMNDSIYQFSSAQESDDGVDIVCYWSPKSIESGSQLLSKRIYINYWKSPTGTARLRLGNMVLDLGYSEGGEPVCLDEDIAYSDMDSLVPIESNSMWIWRQFRGWDLTPRLEVTSGGFSLSALDLYITEV